MAERIALTPTGLRAAIKAIARRGTARETEVCSLYIEGPPGIGKSALVYQSVEEIRKESKAPFALVESRAAVNDVVDVKGVPWPDRERGRTVFFPPSEIPDERVHGAHGLWFIDDFPNAPIAVQNSFYSYLVPPHRLNEHSLPTGYAIVAAGNRTGDASGVFRMGRALANRITIVELKPDKKQWLEWAVPRLHEEVLAFHVSPVSTVERNGRVVDLLFDFDPESVDVAFPSPRQWEAVSRILGMAEAVHLDPTDVRGMLQGTVGVEAEYQFETFRHLYRELPDTAPILEGSGKKWLGVATADGRFALLSAVVLRTGPEHVVNVLRWLTGLDAEYSVLGVKLLVLRLGAKVLLTGANRKEVDQWLETHAELLKEAA